MIDVSYLNQLLDILANRNLLEDVTYIDFSERFSLSFVLSNSTKVEIGSLNDADKKLTLLWEELNKKPIDHNIYESIDVSNTSKTIRKQIEAKNLFE